MQKPKHFSLKLSNFNSFHGIRHFSNPTLRAIRRLSLFHVSSYRIGRAKSMYSTGLCSRADVVLFVYKVCVWHILHRFRLLHYSYTDDTYFYITIKKRDLFADKLSDAEQCVSEIKVWMNHIIFKLNDDKTEFTVFKSKYNINTFVEQNVQVGGTKVEISSKIKNLGVTFDQTLSMQTRVSTMPKTVFIIWETRQNSTYALWGRMQGDCPHFCDFKTGLL